MTDCWGAYNPLNDRGYDHLTVNHTYNFVDPETWAHTQTIESNWRPIKRKIQGIHKKDIAFHFCEFLWRRHAKRRRIHYFEKLIADITQIRWNRPDQ
jgi:hypothetical protein